MLLLIDLTCVHVTFAIVDRRIYGVAIARFCLNIQRRRAKNHCSRSSTFDSIYCPF